MKRAEEELSENKKSLNELQKTINSNPERIDPVTNKAIGNSVQEAEKTRLLNEIANSTREVTAHKNAIEDLNLKSKKII